MQLPDPRKHRAKLEVLAVFGIKSEEQQTRARVVFEEIWKAHENEPPTTTDQGAEQVVGEFRQRIVKGYPKAEAELVLCCLHFVGRARGKEVR